MLIKDKRFSKLSSDVKLLYGLMLDRMSLSMRDGWMDEEDSAFKGVGFLYIKKGTKIASYATGGSRERGLRAGTENVAAIVGMAALFYDLDDNV